MSLEQASLVSQIVSAIAVLVSLVYLGLQIRNNTRALRSQAYFNATSLAQLPLQMMVQDDGLAKIVNTGYAAPQTLSPHEWDRFGNYALMLFNGWEYLYYQQRDSSIPKQLWIGADAWFKDLIKTKSGLARFWAEYQAAYDQPFRSYAAAEFDKRATPAGDAP